MFFERLLKWVAEVGSPRAGLWWWTPATFAARRAEARRIRLAPHYLNEQAPPDSAKPDRDAPVSAPVSPTSPGSTNGVSPIGEKPPDPPKAQALALRPALVLSCAI